MCASLFSTLALSSVSSFLLYHDLSFISWISSFVNFSVKCIRNIADLFFFFFLIVCIRVHPTANLYYLYASSLSPSTLSFCLIPYPCRSLTLSYEFCLYPHHHPSPTSFLPRPNAAWLYGYPRDGWANPTGSWLDVQPTTTSSDSRSTLWVAEAASTQLLCICTIFTTGNRAMLLVRIIFLLLSFRSPTIFSQLSYDKQAEF